MRVKKCLFRTEVSEMKRLSPASYPDPSKPPDGEVQSHVLDGSKRVKTSQSFESLFDKETLSDIVLNVNNGQYIFNAHKMILGLKSDVFASMINDLSPVSSDSERPVLCVVEPGDSAAVFSRLLYFLYSGTVWLHRDYVIQLQKLAERWGVPPLLHHCESFICHTLNQSLATRDTLARGFPLPTVVDLHEDTFQSVHVKNLAFKVLCLCFRDLVMSERWQGCSWELVCDLLKSDFIQAEENIILTSATDWMKKNNLNDKARIEDILINIKYPLLHKKVLYMMQKNGAFKNFPRVQDLVNAAIKYHCFKDIPEAHEEFVGPQFQARRRFSLSNDNNNFAVETSPTSVRYSDSSSREDVSMISSVHESTLGGPDAFSTPFYINKSR